MPTIPPVVDANGNINIHEFEDLSVELRDGEGGAMTARTFVFCIPAIQLRTRVGDHPAVEGSKLIRVALADLRKLRGAESFVLLETTGGATSVRWEGVIRRRMT